MTTPTNLYRHYAEDGSLLYVGISISALHRLRDHVDGSRWADQIRTVRIETYPSRGEAKQAEQTAIRSEQPKYNVQCRKKASKVTIEKVEPKIPGGRYWQAMDAARKLGVSFSDVVEMWASGAIKGYQCRRDGLLIPTSEVQRLQDKPASNDIFADA